MKPIEELKKLDTPKLLKFYKTRRNEFYKQRFLYCYEVNIDIMKQYLIDIKTELNKREHVK